MQSPIIIDEGSDVSEGEVDDEDDSESIIVINNKNREIQSLLMKIVMIAKIRLRNE